MRKIQLSYFIPITVFILFFFVTYGATREFFNPLALMLGLTGLLGSTLAGFNGRTAIAVGSGIAILIFCLEPYRFNDHYWTLVSLFAGSVNLIVAFITHINKTLSKLRILYFSSIAIVIFSLFTQPLPMLNEAAMVTLLFLIGIAGSTVAGFNSMYPNPIFVEATENKIALPPVAEQKKKTMKRALKVVLFLFVFAAIGRYSQIFYAIAKYTHMNFTSTWVASEPLELENWIDHAADGFAGGAGTEGDPFLISTPEQLAYLAKRVNAGTFEFADIKILNDIDLAGKEWTPIGTKQHPFSGRIDGSDAVIYNLTIVTPQDRQGLFGAVSWASLGNLTLVGVDIKGRDFVGGLVGAISRGRIVRSNLAGTIEGRYFVGGLSGYGYRSDIELSTYLGNVKGDVYVGGLIGKHTRNEGDHFLAFTYASAPRPDFLRSYGVAATVFGRKYVGGVVGYSGNLTAILDGFFAGKVRGEVFSAGISGFCSSIREISNNTVLLHEADDNASFAEIAHGARMSNNTVLRHMNDEWHLDSNPLPAEEAENNFLLGVRLSAHFTDCLTDNVLEKLRPPFYVLSIPYGIEISQDVPLYTDLGEKDFRLSSGSLLGGRLWIEGSFFKVSGAMRGIPKGIYAIPCFKNVNGSFETIWVLLNVN